VSQAVAIPSNSAPPVSAPVVVRWGDRIVKGRLESPCWNAEGNVVPSAPDETCDVFHVRRLDANVVEEIPASEVSAVFFVNDFHGDPNRKTVRFHAHETALPGVWIQVKFPTGEVIEGIVENSIRFLVEPGFFLRPTDPGGNNKLVYVMKNALVDHHVLGVTKI
ncbi:MAG: DUF6982 domain-containing protein, partial [Terracidiphilus sp.]